MAPGACGAEWRLAPPSHAGNTMPIPYRDVNREVLEASP